MLLIIVLQYLLEIEVINVTHHRIAHPTEWQTPLDNTYPREFTFTYQLPTTTPKHIEASLESAGQEACILLVILAIKSIETDKIASICQAAALFRISETTSPR